MSINRLDTFLNNNNFDYIKNEDSDKNNLSLNHDNKLTTLSFTQNFLELRGYNLPSQLLNNNFLFLYPKHGASASLMSIICKLTDVAKQTIDSIYIKEIETPKKHVFYHGFQGFYQDEEGNDCFGPGLAYDMYRILADSLLNTETNIPILPRFFHKKKHSQLKTLSTDDHPAIHLLKNTRNRFIPDHDSKVIYFIMSANFYLFGSSMCDASESSLVFFSDNHSIHNFSLTSFFQKAGFNEYYLKQMTTLYKKHFQESGGQMLQIFISPDVVDQLAIVTTPGGVLHENSKFSEVINDLLTTTIKRPNSSFSKKAKQYYQREQLEGIAQARLFCDPEIFSNPEHIQIFEYSYQEEPDRKTYRNELKAIVTEMLTDWFNDPNASEKRNIWLEKRLNITTLPALEHATSD